MVWVLNNFLEIRHQQDLLDHRSYPQEDRQLIQSSHKLLLLSPQIIRLQDHQETPVALHAKNQFVLNFENQFTLNFENQIALIVNIVHMFIVDWLRLLLHQILFLRTFLLEHLPI